MVAKARSEQKPVMSKVIKPTLFEAGISDGASRVLAVFDHLLAPPALRSCSSEKVAGEGVDQRPRLGEARLALRILPQAHIQHQAKLVLHMPMPANEALSLDR